MNEITVAPASMNAMSLARIGDQITSRMIARGMTLDGQCRDVCLATALSVNTNDWCVAMCFGTIAVRGDMHPHWWLRVENFIVDPTAQQYGISNRCRVTNESDAASEYTEKFWFAVHATKLSELIERPRG